jgi:hypothetical protein
MGSFMRLHYHRTFMEVAELHPQDLERQARFEEVILQTLDYSPFLPHELHGMSLGPVIQRGFR